MTPVKIQEILKSGEFTIIYWDSDGPTLYQKKWDKQEEFDRDEYATMEKFKIPIDTDSSGYTPAIVELLVEALGGVSDSI